MRSQSIPSANRPISANAPTAAAATATSSRGAQSTFHHEDSPDTNDDNNANNSGNNQYSNNRETAISTTTPTPTTRRTTDVVISLDELKYGFSSFHAISTPVSITMILAALAVTYIQVETSTNSDEVSSFYTIFDVSDTSNSDAKNFGLSLINGLVIISVIAAATFVIVLLYKYRCMKLLLGYMIFSSTALLGLLGGVMFRTFIERYNVLLDQITFYFLLVNFAAVGTISIFFAKGIPTYITQMYLVLTSCILAWQLSFFNDWTAWVLLVLLALYDLCAVLTPCGPLKALVRLMQKDDAPEMPGLLYEARLPEGVERPSGGGGSGDGTRSGRSTMTTSGRNSSSMDSWNASERGDGIGIAGRNQNENNVGTMEDATSVVGQHRNSAYDNQNQNGNNRQEASRLQVAANHINSAQAENGGGADGGGNNDVIPGVLPFAIAKIYKLPIRREGCPQFVIDKYRPRSDPPIRSEYTSSELLTEVNVLYPRNGGKIVVQGPDADESAPRWRRSDGTHLPRYVIFDRNGVLKRVLVMNEDGKVFEEVRGDRSERRNSGGGASNMSNTIKLGLGDFIFYSVLVAKAALNSFTTFASCMLVILAGLGGTLVLLSVYHSALPALPISIFLGVIFYFTTKVLIEPWIETILSVPFYV